MMPGQWLHRIARRLCRAETDRVLEPLIADLQREWSDAKPGSGRALTLARAYASFWCSIGACALRTAARGAVSPIDREMTTSGAGALACALLGITMLRIVGRTNWQETPRAIALGELSAWTSLGIFALVPVFMYARRQPDRRWDATASRMLAAALLISVVCVGWIGPALFGAAEHAHGHFLDGRVQPSFESLPTVVRMVRGHASDADWPHFLYGRMMMIADALLLALIGWQLSASRRPSILRATLCWFALMELVLFSGNYAHNQAEWRRWLASGVLVLILFGLHAAARRRRLNPPAPPALPDLPAPVSS